MVLGEKWLYNRRHRKSAWHVFDANAYLSDVHERSLTKRLWRGYDGARFHAHFILRTDGFTCPIAQCIIDTGLRIITADTRGWGNLFVGLMVEAFGLVHALPWMGLDAIDDSR